MGLITNMRSRMQVVMWTILVLFVTSMAIGGLVGGASITDIFGGRQANEVGSLNGKPILFEDFNQLVSNEINRLDSQSGRQISDEEREYIRAVVWERLIADLIVQEQIEKNKIVVGDEWSAGNLSYHLNSRPIWFNDLKDIANSISEDQGVIYVGNPEILKKICPGVFGEIKPTGYCMIGMR